MMINRLWKSAKNIKAGDKIIDANGKLEQVDNIEIKRSQDYTRIYNLNVEDYHTYFVGNEELLVHNECTIEQIAAAKEAIEAAKAKGETDPDKLEAIGKTSYVKSIEDLKNIENFNQGTKHNALKHIFEGEINPKTGQSMGFHYEGFPGCKGKIIGNLDQPNEFGVYRANVEIDGVTKGPKTTFFPKDYSPQEVIDIVNEAFANKEVYKNNIYRGKSKSGMEIEFVIKKGKIDSAYPLY